MWGIDGQCLWDASGVFWVIFSKEMSHTCNMNCLQQRLLSERERGNMQISSPNRKTDFMGRRILVVERSRTIQTLLSIYFRSAGHRVLVYSTPQEALRVLADLRDAPDYLFLAVHAHEQDDYRLLQYVKTQATCTRVSLVALVLQEDLAQVQRRLSDMQMSYLVKPFRVQDALALVSLPVPEHVVASEMRRE